MLRNLLDIHDADALDDAANQFASVAWVDVRRSPPASLAFDFLEAAHHRMFSRVFEWAGELRTVPLSPYGLNRDYCAPEAVPEVISDVFAGLEEESFLQGLDSWDFCEKLAGHWATLTFAHPFRDGNTRTQSLWVSELSTRAGHEFDWSAIHPAHLRDARLASWNGFPSNLASYLHARVLPSGSGIVMPRLSP